jgi:hypothetical protein
MNIDLLSTTTNSRRPLPNAAGQWDTEEYILIVVVGGGPQVAHHLTMGTVTAVITTRSPQSLATMTTTVLNMMRMLHLGVDKRGVQIMVVMPRETTMTTVIQFKTGVTVFLARLKREEMSMEEILVKISTALMMIL